MPSENLSTGSSLEWLRYAQSDLELAQISAPAMVMLEGLCFHAQQAAEKSLKAVLIAFKIPYPKTHSIRKLLDILSEKMEIPEDLQEAAILNDYAVTTRYPGAVEPIEDDEYYQAISLAKAVYTWAVEEVNKVDD